jgi:hypothetical protein
MSGGTYNVGFQQFNSMYKLLMGYMEKSIYVFK